MEKPARLENYLAAKRVRAARYQHVEQNLSRRLTGTEREQLEDLSLDQLATLITFTKDFSR